MKDRYVGVSGDDSSNLCGVSEAAPFKTVGNAVGSSMAHLSSTITVLGGIHVSEVATISVGEKKISVVGGGKAVSERDEFSLYVFDKVIGSSSINVFAMSVGVGILSLVEITANSRPEGDHLINASVFMLVMPQLQNIAVEVKKLDSAVAPRLQSALLLFSIFIATFTFLAFWANPGTWIIEKFFCFGTSLAAPFSGIKYAEKAYKKRNMQIFPSKNKQSYRYFFFRAEKITL